VTKLFSFAILSIVCISISHPYSKTHLYSVAADFERTPKGISKNLVINFWLKMLVLSEFGGKRLYININEPFFYEEYMRRGNLKKKFIKLQIV